MLGRLWLTLSFAAVYLAHLIQRVAALFGPPPDATTVLLLSLTPIAMTGLAVFGCLLLE